MTAPAGGDQNVMDLANVAPIALAFGIHLAMVFVQLSLAVFLIASGARDREALVRRLGVFPR